MEEFFKELGDSVLERWKRDNFSLAKFPEIARDSMAKRPPADTVDLASLMRDFLLNEEQPGQTDSPFGEPELIVYKHPRFFIQLLFWMDGTTAIHQHEFSGAFHVMHGSSVHAHYDFETTHPVTPYLRVGNLRMKKMELLEAGRTVPITSGQRDIHSLFHLDSPSVTVVIRTQHDPGTGPQLNYLPPHIAFDPQFSDALMLRRLQLLDVMERTEDPGYLELVLQMTAELDFERSFSLLHHCMGNLQQLDAWDRVVRVFEKKHRALAEGVAVTLKEDVRRNTIKSLRGAIFEPEHRFFLALLMNAPTRADLLKLVAQRFPNEAPTEIVMRWVLELTEVTEDGVVILDATFPSTIEVDGDEQTELFLTAFRVFLNRSKKLPRTLRELSDADMDELRSAFAESALGVLTT